MDFRYNQSTQGVTSNSAFAYVGDFVEKTNLEGPGDRFAIWFSGCTIRCPGCCNPHFFKPADDQKMNVTTILKAIDASMKEHSIEGVSFLGGEPLEQPEALLVLVKEIKGMGLTNMIFSGYQYEEILKKNLGKAILSHVDLLVDGPFLEEQRTTDRRFIGSRNQNLLFLTEAYQPDDPRFHEPNAFEIRLKDGEVFIHGFPNKFRI